MSFLQSFLTLIVLYLSSLTSWGQPRVFPHPERIRYDSKCLQIDGKDIFIYSGAFHYFRVPQPLWRDRFKKMKEAGFNCVETYVPWNWHERTMPKSIADYSKINLQELKDWLVMAESFGFYIIIRPGPYICAEWSGGGFPQWLLEKRPKKFDRAAWLQSDDPEFLKWNQHWYSAVCRAIAPFQITKRKAGEPGIILFQIENEYERVNWFPSAMKKRYLEDLAVCAKQYGIDVPIFTCWTSQSRNVKSGPLAGVWDFVNAYPRWNVQKNLTNQVEKQVKEQPDAPLMSAELQGGWYSEVGGQLSRNTDGVAPVQTQNLTLFALQQGFTLINYYMLVGGSNFDDWASRETTTSYDFAAAIGENGNTGDKYQRLKAIGKMLQEHGRSLVRSEAVPVEVMPGDPEVQVSLRRSADGSRFYFVRTEARDKVHFGTAKVIEKGKPPFSFNYSLEPFGSMVLYVGPEGTNAEDMKWYPEQSAPIIHKQVVPAEIKFSRIQYRPDELPVAWHALQPDQQLDRLGFYDRHDIYYEANIPAGRQFVVGRIGDKKINNSKADGIIVKVNQQLLQPLATHGDSVLFVMPAGEHQALILFESRGLHHHTKRIVEDNWSNGLLWVMVDGQKIPLKFASVEKKRGVSYTEYPGIGDKGWKIIDTSAVINNELLIWQRVKFVLPDSAKNVPVPYMLTIEGKGNGFVYLNGKCIGRYWEDGPQKSFYLPECWLHFGKGMINSIAISLRPTNLSVGLRSIAINAGSLTQ